MNKSVTCMCLILLSSVFGVSYTVSFGNENTIIMYGILLMVGVSFIPLIIITICVDVMVYYCE